jgi:TRAP-type C4-dicarboxylate transport system permease small subunit
MVREMSFKFNLLARAGTIFNHILYASYFLACVLIVSSTVSVCIEVVMRYFLGRPQIWVVETVSYSLLFITFLSAAPLHRSGTHIRMDLLLSKFSSRNQALINVVTSILAGIGFLILAWYTGRLTWGLYLQGARVVSGLEPPKAPIIAIIPLGSFILSIESLKQAYGYFRSWRTSSEQVESS